MNISRLSLGVALALAAGFIAGARKPQATVYEFEREMPVFLDSIQASLTYPLAWRNDTTGDFEQWRRTARAKIFECMLEPPTVAAEPALELVAEERRDGYTAFKYMANISAWSRAAIYVLMPDGPGTHPAVVALHDHGGHYSIGKEKMIRPFACDSAVVKDADAWAAQCYGGRYFGDYLASRGYAVISHDALLWGERGRREGPDGRALERIAGNFLMLGRSLSGFMTYDDIAVTEILASLPGIDPQRIGAVGFSMGAYRSWMLAALSDRIKAQASVCWMTTTADQLSWAHGREKGGHINLLPGLRRWLDYPDIASLAAPRAAYFINGASDKLFHPDGVAAAYGVMRDVYRSQSADTKFRGEIWPMPHDCGIAVQDSVAAFFDRELR